MNNYASSLENTLTHCGKACWQPTNLPNRAATQANYSFFEKENISSL